MDLWRFHEITTRLLLGTTRLVTSLVLGTEIHEIWMN